MAFVVCLAFVSMSVVAGVPVVPALMETQKLKFKLTKTAEEHHIL